MWACEMRRSLGAPGTNGRGPLVLAGTDPGVTYHLIYYLIDSGHALLLDQDKTLVNIGLLSNQF